jgi:hypothetical protein
VRRWHSARDRSALCGERVLHPVHQKLEHRLAVDRVRVRFEKARLCGPPHRCMHLGRTHPELDGQLRIGPRLGGGRRQLEDHDDVLGLQAHAVGYSRFANRANARRHPTVRRKGHGWGMRYRGRPGRFGLGWQRWPRRIRWRVRRPPVLGNRSYDRRNGGDVVVDTRGRDGFGDASGRRCRRCEGRRRVDRGGESLAGVAWRCGRAGRYASGVGIVNS